MALAKINPTETNAWKKLNDHYTEQKKTFYKRIVSK
jgi:hypothetical protein